MTKKMIVEKIEQISSGFLKLVRLNLVVPKFNGGTMNIVREVALQDDSVMVLPYDAATNKVLIITQHRPGMYLQKESITYEAIAGRLDKNLTAEATAIAEAKEEADLSINEGDLHLVGTYALSPGGSTEKTTIFIAHCDLSSITNKSVNGCDHESEDIQTHILDKDDAIKLLKNTCNSSVTLQLGLLSI